MASKISTHGGEGATRVAYASMFAPYAVGVESVNNLMLKFKALPNHPHSKRGPPCNLTALLS
jgi:hypothetical protein